jgi:hypothetical protein
VVTDKLRMRLGLFDSVVVEAVSGFDLLAERLRTRFAGQPQ